ncbi:putative beta/gamma crystallin domain-containing protein [Namao virus]|nr:putative beta/gamma crystallin domain-containing protein [Namao virus]
MDAQNKIVLYISTGCVGSSKTFKEHECNNKNIISLQKRGKCYTIASVQVFGQPWVLYNYNPLEPWPAEDEFFVVLEEGKYPELSFNSTQKITHLLFISDNLFFPEIELFENQDQSGQKIEIADQIKFLNGSTFKSYNVKSGAWLMHCENNTVLLKSNDNKKSLCGRDVVKGAIIQAYPLKPGRSEVHAKILWSKKTEEFKCAIIDQFTAVNKDLVPKQFNFIKNKEYKIDLTNIFSFDPKSKLKPGTEFLVNMASDDNFCSVSTSSMRIIKGYVEQITEIGQYFVEIPLTVGPCSSIDYSIIQKEVSGTVPVKLTIVHSKKHKTVEMATYKYQGIISIHSEINMAAIC